VKPNLFPIAMTVCEYNSVYLSTSEMASGITRSAEDSDISIASQKDPHIEFRTQQLQKAVD